MNGIHDDNNTSGIRYLDSLIDTTSDSKQFDFSLYDFGSMVDCLPNIVRKRMDMGNRYGDVISNTSV